MSHGSYRQFLASISPHGLPNFITLGIYFFFHAQESYIWHVRHHPISISSRPCTFFNNLRLATTVLRSLRLTLSVVGAKFLLSSTAYLRNLNKQSLAADFLALQVSESVCFNLWHIPTFPTNAPITFICCFQSENTWVLGSFHNSCWTIICRATSSF